MLENMLSSSQSLYDSPLSCSCIVAALTLQATDKARGPDFQESAHPTWQVVSLLSNTAFPPCPTSADILRPFYFNPGISAQQKCWICLLLIFRLVLLRVLSKLECCKTLWCEENAAVCVGVLHWSESAHGAACFLLGCSKAKIRRCALALAAASWANKVTWLCDDCCNSPHPTVTLITVYTEQYKVHLKFLMCL